MVKNICLLFLFIITVKFCHSQVLPKEGSKLNYRIIGFSFPSVVTASKYMLEIAKGNLTDEASFRKNIILKINCDSTKVIAEVPDFGMAYTWRISVKGGIGDLHHFSTYAFPDIEQKIRLRITKNAETYKDAYVFVDGFRALFDMNGNPVWFLPTEADNPYQGIRDLKITPQNTITFLTDRNQAYEINYQGNILWSAPENKNDAINTELKYHHEFTRMSSGHYIVSGNEQLLWGDLAKPGSLKSSDSALNNKKIILGTIIEYDEQGKVIWEWKSSDYFKLIGLYYFNTTLNDPDYDPHMNSFYFDEKQKEVYVSFKKISRIIKIKYPEGNLLKEYGADYKNGDPPQGSEFFCSQHSCKVTQDGYLYFYNNNDCNYPDHPSVLITEESENASEPLKKVWEYVCPVIQEGTIRQGKPPLNSYSSGGNVTELPDRSMLINLSNPYGFSPLSGVSIVSREKKIIWSGVPEKWNKDTKQWQTAPVYRVSIIKSRRIMDDLIRKVEELK